MILASCTSFETHTPRTEGEIIADAYTGVVDQIKRLSNTGQIDTWISSNQQPFRIKTLEDLDSALSYFGEIPQAQTEVIKSEFAKSNTMYHFGYDGDFSVLVAFDDKGYQTYIFPTSMAPTN